MRDYRDCIKCFTNQNLFVAWTTGSSYHTVCSGCGATGPSGNQNEDEAVSRWNKLHDNTLPEIGIYGPVRIF